MVIYSIRRVKFVPFVKTKSCECEELYTPVDFFIARNRGHFASVINCQRHLFFKMADKNNRSQGKRFPYDILNNLSSLDLFYEVYIP